MSTSETLNAAADLIEERGWIRGSGGWPHGEADKSPLCLEGGIMAATGMFFFDTENVFKKIRLCPAYKAVQEYLDHQSALYEWNDERNRTAEEVVGILRAAALVEATKEAKVEVPV